MLDYIQTNNAEKSESGIAQKLTAQLCNFFLITQLSILLITTGVCFVHVCVCVYINLSIDLLTIYQSPIFIQLSIYNHYPYLRDSLHNSEQHHLNNMTLFTFISSKSYFKHRNPLIAIYIRHFLRIYSLIKSNY